jgi:hypothetical protein
LRKSLDNIIYLSCCGRICVDRREHCFVQTKQVEKEKQSEKKKTKKEKKKNDEDEEGEMEANKTGCSLA